MYGTIARFRMKPENEPKLLDLIHEYENREVPGSISEFVYRMDKDPNAIMLVVVFRDRESYFANADSPEQDAFYRRFVQLLEGEPEWNDGEIIYHNQETITRQ